MYASATNTLVNMVYFLYKLLFNNICRDHTHNTDGADSTDHNDITAVDYDADLVNSTTVRVC